MYIAIVLTGMLLLLLRILKYVCAYMYVCTYV
jgi:hypothetical protein